MPRSRDPRSPIKDNPLRLPGQSLVEAREKLLDDKLETWVLAAGSLIVVAGLEWYQHLAGLPPQPWLYTAIALLMTAIAAWRVWRHWPQLKALKLGIEGERVVGQFLERLRAQGYDVFHDVLADGYNIDHVLIGPAGVFTVETKTWTKPRHGDATIRFDGQTLLAGGHTPDRDLVRQARGQVVWLQRMLQESTGRKLPVRPVIVFPGWFVEPGSHRDDLWLLEPKALPAFIAREPARMSPEDVKMASFHLSRYIRVRERE
jgi:hypothetical protein